MKFFITLSAIFVASLFWGELKSQSLTPLNIGDTVSSTTWQSLVQNDTPKLIILDFWSSYCVSCLAGFPRMENLQNQFAQKMKIILINTSENPQAISVRFSIINSKRAADNKISLPKTLLSINGDSRFKTMFPHESVPHYVWINGEGVVIAVTTAEAIIAENIKAFLLKNEVPTQIKDDQLKKDLLSNGFLKATVPNTVIFYSAFIPNTVGGSKFRNVDSIAGTFRKSITLIDPIAYLRFAFREPGSKERVLYEAKNVERLFYPKNKDSIPGWKRKHAFTYELQGRLQDEKFWQKKMQIDANDFFGNLFGVEAVKEKRSFSCYVLTIAKEGLLNTTGKKRQIISNDSVRSWVNVDFKDVVKKLQLMFENVNLSQLFVDDTGFSGNVDITITGDVSDLNVVITKLNEYGLSITKIDKQVEVLVIRDRVVSK